MTIIGICHRTDSFTSGKIIGSLSNDHTLQIKPLTILEKKQIQKIVDQPFYYLDRGRQSFVFESADHRFVLKFFNYNRYRIPYFLEKFCHYTFLRFVVTDAYFHKLSRKKARLDNTFKAYKLAYDFLPDETGIKFIQFYKNTHWNQEVLLLNKIGSKIRIDLDKVCFVLQEKAVSMPEAFSKISFDENSSLETAIFSLLHTISTRLKKGIMDSDIKVTANYGFLGDRAVFMDPGRITLKKDMDFSEYSDQLYTSTYSFRNYLADSYPDMLDYYDFLYSQFLEDFQ